MPWTFVDGGLNTDYQYSGTDMMGSSAILVKPSDGFDFTPGNIINIQYIEGSIRSSVAGFFHDANGEGPPQTVPYFDPTNPIFLMMLVAVFTDDTGQIVSPPVPIGDSGQIVVPEGATQLQIGFWQAQSVSQGSVLIYVTGLSNVSPPEPAGPPIYGKKKPTFKPTTTTKFKITQEP
jgi:hypothetical protein